MPKLPQTPKFYILLAVVGLVVLSILGVYIYNFPKPTVAQDTIETQVFIYSDSLAGATTAIQLSNLNIPFVIASPSQYLGGQATEQGVTTFDDKKKLFQLNSIYADILQAMKTDGASGPYLGNAVTGPGNLPIIVENYIQNKLQNKNAKILLNSEILKVEKSQDKVSFVEIKDKSTNKNLKIQAKKFVDASDFSELSVKAGLPYRLGMDKQSDTKEVSVLNDSELDVFKNGIVVDGKSIGGFSNRTQPITSVFSVLDKGYYGYRYDLKEFIQSSQSSCPTPDSPSCLKILPGQTITLPVTAPSNSLFQSTFVFDGTYTADSIPDIKVNGEIMRILPEQNILDGNKTVLRPTINAKTQKIGISITNKSPQDLFLSEFILTESSKERADLADTLADLRKSSVLSIDKSQESVDSQTPSLKDLNFDIPTSTLEPQIPYYLIADLTAEELQRVGKINVAISIDGQRLNEFNFNPQADLFNGYIPLHRMVAGTAKKFSIKFSSDRGEPIKFKNILVVPESKVNGFKILNAGNSYNLPSNKFLDIWTAGSVSDLVFKQNNSDGKNVVENFSKEDATTGVRFLNRYHIDAGDSFSVSGDNRALHILRYLNEDHYTILSLKNTGNLADTGVTFNIDAGQYRAELKINLPNDLLKTLAGQDITIEMNGVENDFGYIEKVKVSRNGVFDLPVFNIAKSGKLNFKISLDCPKNLCQDYLKLMVLENIELNKYEPHVFNGFINRVSTEGKLLRVQPRATSFFAYRQIVDAANIFTSTLPQVQEASKNVIFNSIGASQVNTILNDFEFDDIDILKYATDLGYRQEIDKKATNLSKDYYYWLKYDSPKAYLGCEKNEYFCSGLRMELWADGVNNSSGFASKVYIREGVRMVGTEVMTEKDVLTAKMPCTSQETDCITLKYIDRQGKTIDYQASLSTLTNFSPDTLAGMFYPVDVHKIVSKDLDKFLLYLRDTKQRTLQNEPIFINGIFDNRVRGANLRLSYMHNPEISNLMFCGKNISVSQIANGVSRLHPSEAAIGQACGIVVGYTLNNSTSVKDLNTSDMQKLQRLLVEQGVRLLAIEDEVIPSLFNEKKYDVLYSYYKLILDQLVSAIPSQDQYLNSVTLKLQPELPATNQEIAKVLEKLSIQVSQTELANQTPVNIINSLNIDDTKKQEMINSITQYREKVGLVSDAVISRGDLAWLNK